MTAREGQPSGPRAPSTPPAACSARTTRIRSTLPRPSTPRPRPSLHRLVSTASTGSSLNEVTAGNGAWSRRALALAAAAAVVVGVVGVGTGAVPVSGADGPAAQAATPDLLLLPAGPGRPGQAQLLELAERAEARSAPTATPAPYRYNRSRAWYQNTPVTRESVSSQLQEEMRESWLAADGSGTVTTTRGGETHRQDRGPGQGTGPPAEQFLSNDPEVLAQQLLGYPSQPGRDNEEVPDAMERLGPPAPSLAGEQLGPDLTAALLRVLADQGLTAYGSVTDRAGRDGLAFTKDSDYAGLPTTYVLVLDPATGQVLDHEAVLTETAGSLNVEVPSVLGYDVFLESGGAPSVGARPVIIS